MPHLSFSTDLTDLPKPSRRTRSLATNRFRLHEGGRRVWAEACWVGWVVIELAMCDEVIDVSKSGRDSVVYFQGFEVGGVALELRGW